MKNKTGQVTIFIIIAIMIVVMVAIYFLFRQELGLNITDTTSEENPAGFLELCLRDSVEETIRIIGEQGGSLDPELYINFRFEGENEKKIKYLCYNQNYYKPCVNQEPLLMQHLEEEIKAEVEEDVRSCFDRLVENLNREYTVEVRGYRGFSLILMPKRAKIDIDAEIVLTKAGKRITQNNFEFFISSNLYALADVAQEIVYREAKDCYFEHIGYMMFYPEFKIKKIQALDSSIIYRITNRKTTEKFNFAIRGCVNPPGY